MKENLVSIELMRDFYIYATMIRMNTVTISQLKEEPLVRFSGKNVNLPLKEQSAIDMYWQSLLDSGKSYTRGDVFTITQVEKGVEGLSLLVEKTDYAHYLYCQNIDSDLNGYGISIIFTACLIETLDNKILFGKMGSHTARAGIYQLAGGGIDKTDLIGDHFDLRGNIAKEIFEEVGVDISDINRVKHFSAAYLKQGGIAHKIAVVYRLQLLETSEIFLQQYSLFSDELKKKDELPEFGEIIVLNNNKKDIDLFFVQHENECDEYMEPLFRYVYAS